MDFPRNSGLCCARGADQSKTPAPEPQPGIGGEPRRNGSKIRIRIGFRRCCCIEWSLGNHNIGQGGVQATKGVDGLLQPRGWIAGNGRAARQGFRSRPLNLANFCAIHSQPRYAIDMLASQMDPLT